MRPEYRDVRWRSRLADGLAEAAEQRRMVVVKPAGQGADGDDWCPGATRMRAVALSDPEIARLINTAFVPVRFGMTLPGLPESDPEGRAFVFETLPYGMGSQSLPGILIVTPERELVARVESTATKEELLAALKRALVERPDLAPADLDPPVVDDNDVAAVTLRDIEARFAAGDTSALAPALEGWLEQYGDAWDHGAAVAWTLLGAIRYQSKDFLGADAAWQTVVDRYPDHPLRHRAQFNLLHTEFSPLAPHPDLQGATHADLGRKPIFSPHPEVRARNLERMQRDTRYLWTKSGLPLVRIPAGTFVMGGQPALFPRELPLRRVTITRPMYMAAWPITRGLWRRLRPEHVPIPSDLLADELPIARTTFSDATAFCRLLSEVDGHEYRLPTEAEWEYAARGGVDGAPYPWGHDPTDATRCNYLYSMGVPVASYEPNGFGLFDMVGNLLEWTRDVYREDAYAQTPEEVDDPVNLSGDTDQVHVTRGGPAGLPFCRFMCRTSFRMFTPDSKGFSFRVVAPA